MLPWFLVLPPRGFGVLTTLGRKTGKRRQKCVRVIVRQGQGYLAAIKGTTAWSKNIAANPRVVIRIPQGTFVGLARELREDEVEEARAAYCDTVVPFDYMECLMWIRGLPSRKKIRELHGSWFEDGKPLVIEILRRVSEPQPAPVVAPSAG